MSNYNLSFTNTKQNFTAGKTAECYNNWKKLTHDKWILETICGYKVELSKKPWQNFVPSPLKFADIEQGKIDEEIQRFLDCKIIEPVTVADADEYISNIFLRPKKDGSIRIILNLRTFNKSMQFIHFKMETLKTAINLMTRNCYFASIDIADAYYSIPIASTDRKYFRFIHRGKKYQFTALVMGLTTAPRVFTKILKPVFSSLREKGHVSTAYLDDSCLQGQTYESCLKNVCETVTLMDSLGLTINLQKSQFNPSQQIEFVGFLLCSKTMTVRLTKKKAAAIIKQCLELMSQKSVTIKQFAQLIGKLVAADPGVKYAPLYYKPLEKAKIANLRAKKGNFNAFMKITNEIRSDIQWWVSHLPTSYRLVSHGNPDIELFTDASLDGYGACIKTLDLKTNGVWSLEEQQCHINVLELKACYYGLKALCPDRENVHIRIYTDNTTCCAYLNNFGGKFQELNLLARDIWLWCIKRNIHLSAAHIPGIENTEADRLSRRFNDDLEWSLDKTVFEDICDQFGVPNIDMFASRLNYKVQKFISLRPDPLAFAIDAFSLDWGKDLLYMFPPFSVIPRVLQKIRMDQAEVIIVVPLWSTQSWWPHLIDLAVQPVFSLPSPTQILSLPHRPEHRHPLKKMALGAFLLSGRRSEDRGTRAKP